MTTQGPTWRQPQPSDAGKYAFIESLPSDAPPALLRAFKPLKWDELIDAFQCDMNAPLRWQYWTVAGWADLTGTVCVCERPEDE